MQHSIEKFFTKKRESNTASTSSGDEPPAKVFAEEIQKTSDSVISGICLEDFAVEVLAYIFKFCSIQDRLKIACVCKRFKDVIDSTGEIWRTFNTDDELTVHQFDLVIVKHSNHLNHVSLRFSQKCVRYNSSDLYIESALAMCKHLTYLD